ncbi:15252_t:CDS:2, partial [Funneliformis geosporum]
ILISKNLSGLNLEIIKQVGWKHFGIKTDGHAYYRYKILKNGIEEEYNYSCMYNTQTSTQQHHLNSVHKKFEKEKLQCELRNALADWLVTDSQPFNSANREGFLRMINKLDSAFKQDPRNI